MMMQPQQQQQQQQQGPLTGWYATYYNQIQQTEMTELQKWFRSMDRDNSGSISAAELANVAIGGIRLGIEVAIKLIRIFDTDNSGEIDFNEYAALHKFLLSMQVAFKKADTDGNGRLDSTEIHNALRESGFNISFNACNCLHRKYNKTGQGLDMAEFIALVAHIALARSIFERRDFQKQGVITLKLDELTQISAELS